jgi:hypothetical protein
MISPAALEAYARDLAHDRQQAAAHAALVAEAHQARPTSPARLSLSLPTTAAHLAVLLTPLSVAFLRLARR